MSSRTTSAFTALVFFVLAEPARVSAASITLMPSKDATIFGESANQGIPNTDGQDLFDRSNGAAPGIFAGGNGALAPHRGLIAFDIAGQIPAGSVITGARLTLYIGIVAGSGGAPGLGDPNLRTMDLHRLTTDWGEGVTGANATRIGGTGQGFPANPGDATWNAAAYQATPWTTPGGDYEPTVSASLPVGRDFYSAQTWGSTPELVQDVQAWLDDPAANYGWILINRDENQRQTHRAFYSREWSDPALRPQLQLTYEAAPVPLPPALWLFGTAGIALVRLARRRPGVNRLVKNSEGQTAPRSLAVWSGKILDLLFSRRTNDARQRYSARLPLQLRGFGSAGSEITPPGGCGCWWMAYCGRCRMGSRRCIHTLGALR